MRQLTRMLVLLDRPSAGVLLARAVDLARRSGAQLTLACLPDDEAASPVDTWLQSLAAATPGAQLRVLPEATADSVVREVIDNGHDLLMKSAVVEHGLLPQLWVSLDEHLLRECPCPVWLDRPPQRSRRVLAAIPLEPEGLAAEILDLASGIATLERGQLHLLHPWVLEGESAMRGQALTQGEEEEIDRLLEAELARRETALGLLLAPLRSESLSFELHLEKGEPDVVIPHQAAALGADLVVIGSVTEGSFGGLVLRNTAEEVVAQLACTLVAVKPPGPAAEASGNS